MMLARGFHHAAGELEALQRRMIHKPSKRWVPLLLTLNKTSIGRRIYWLVSNGRHFGRHFLCDTPPIKPDQGLGRAAGAVVLEALAIELVLKARLLRVGITHNDIFPFRDRHDHIKLYGHDGLSPAFRQEAEQRYKSSRRSAMRATLAEVLSCSANALSEWRYLHQKPFVQASLGEMQCAFDALSHGM